MEQYTLANVEDEAKLYPRSFLIHSRLARESLNIGDQAKLVFRDDHDGERMWVKITNRSLRTGKYEGKLQSCPLVIEMKYGDKVTFGLEHVAEIYRIVR